MCDVKRSLHTSFLPIQGPINDIFGVIWPLVIIFIIKTPRRHYLVQKKAYWVLTGHCWSYSVAWMSWQEYKTMKELKVHQNLLFPQPGVNHILHAGSSPRYLFFRFEFQKGRLENVGAVGGQHFGLPIDKATAQAVTNSTRVQTPGYVPKKTRWVFLGTPT